MDTKYLREDERRWYCGNSDHRTHADHAMVDEFLERLCECRKQVEELQRSPKTHRTWPQYKAEEVARFEARAVAAESALATEQARVQRDSERLDWLIDWNSRELLLHPCTRADIDAAMQKSQPGLKRISDALEKKQ